MRTYVDTIKENAEVNVVFTSKDIITLQSILVKHVQGLNKLDDTSWATIESLCERIDQCAREQNLIESKSVEL